MGQMCPPTHPPSPHPASLSHHHDVISFVYFRSWARLGWARPGRKSLLSFIETSILQTPRSSRHLERMNGPDAAGIINADPGDGINHGAGFRECFNWKGQKIVVKTPPHRFPNKRTMRLRSAFYRPGRNKSKHKAEDSPPAVTTLEYQTQTPLFLWVFRTLNRDGATNLSAFGSNKPRESH